MGSCIWRAERTGLWIVDQNEEAEREWNHAKSVAYFAYNLTKNKNMLSLPVNDEYMYLLGLMNNIGNQLLVTSTEEQLQAIKETCSKYVDMAEKVEDMFLSGSAGCFLSLSYMRKLGFSQQIYDIFGAWECMRMASEDVQNILHTIYMAEVMQYYDEGIIEYFQIRTDILTEFQIENENQFKYALTRMKQNLLPK